MKFERNISSEFLRQKKRCTGDPLNHFGIMTLNNLIPYKKPVIKEMPCFVNARGVIKEIEEKHGGFYQNKDNESEELIKS